MSSREYVLWDICSPGSSGDRFEDVGAGDGIFSGEEDMGFEGEVVVKVDSKEQG